MAKKTKEPKPDIQTKSVNEQACEMAESLHEFCTKNNVELVCLVDRGDNHTYAMAAGTVTHNALMIAALLNNQMPIRIALGVIM